MTVLADDVIEYLNETLEVASFRDYGPNGLQVEGRRDVARVVTGVSANLALFERAAEAGADLIVVHHGLIWRGGIERVVGTMARRLAFLLARGIGLAAYHLPLDKHPRLGNNAAVCDALGLGAERASFGELRGHALGLAGVWPAPVARTEALARISATVLGGAQPNFVFAHGPAQVRTVGVCSGGASDMVEAAAAAGCDLFLTGELSEPSAAVARERAITLVGGGHHRTEVFGPRRLVDELKTQFTDLHVEFLDVPSPL